MAKVHTAGGGIQEYTPDEIVNAIVTNQWFDYDPDEKPRINIVKPSGTVISIDFTPENMRQVLSRKGYRLESPEEEHRGWVNQEYGTSTGELSAALLGGARGLTFGISDLALEKLGIYTAEELDNWRTANPGISLASEITGAVAPIIATGGAAAPGVERSLLKQIFSKAPTVQTAKMAGKFEAQLAKVLKATSNPNLVERAIAKGISKGLPVAVEGGVYGAGIGLSESVLKDKPLLSEETAAYMGMGALVGGVLGVGLPAAKGLIFGEKAAPEVLAKLTGPRVGMKIEGVTIPKIIEAPPYKPFPGITGPIKKAAVKGYATVSGILSGQDKKLIEKFLSSKAARATAVEWRKAMPELVETIGQRGAELTRSFDELVMLAEDKFGVELIANPAWKKAYPNYNKIYAGNRALYDAEMKLAPIPSLYNEETVTAILTGPKRANFIKNIGQELSAMEEAASVINKLFKDHGLPIPMQITKGLEIRTISTARSVLDKNLEKAVTSAELEAELGMLGKSGKEYIEDALTRKLIPGGAGYLIGGPIGAGLGYTLSNPSMIAKGLYHIDKSIDRIIESRIVKALQTVKFKAGAGVPIAVRAWDAWREKGKRKIRAGLAENKQEVFKDIVSKIEPLSDPEVLQARLNDNLANLQEEFPDIATDLNMTVQRAVAHLLSNLPMGRMLTALEAAQGKSPRISEAELEKIFRKIVAIEDPLSVLEDLIDGKVSKDAVDTVREVYPSLYAKMTTKIMEALAMREKPISYDMKIQLTYLLGMPMDYTLRPEFIAQAQMNLKPQESPAGMRPPGSRGAKVSQMSVANLTKAQAIEGKRTA